MRAASSPLQAALSTTTPPVAMGEEEDIIALLLFAYYYLLLSFWSANSRSSYYSIQSYHILRLSTPGLLRSALITTHDPPPTLQ